MRQWIREHPWRLEIVPFLIVIISIIMPLWQQRNVSSIVPLPFGSMDWWFSYFSLLVSMLFFWFWQLADNHTWVLKEHHKKFNYNILILNTFMLLRGYVGIWTFYEPDSYIKTMQNWTVLGITLIGISVIIELARPFKRLESGTRHNTRVHEIKSGDHFYYSEFNRNWLWCIVYTMAAIWLGLRVWQWVGEIWVGALAVVLQLVLLNTALSSRLIITKGKITFRQGLSKTTISMLNVTRCQVRENATGKTFGEVNFPLWLTVWSRSGRIYSFNTANPETACHLINTAIAGREQSNSDGEQ